MLPSLTDVLDLVGLLLLVAAAAVLAWPVSAALALALAGVGVLVVSWLVDRRRGGGRR